MNFDPQKFFIGLIDFFSILLPGALLTYLLKDQVGPGILGEKIYLKIEGTEGAMVFLFSSYLLGHFLFLVGSLLDDLIYDPIRRRTDEAQINRLLHGRKLSPRLIRWLASLFFKRRANAVVDRVVPIKEVYLSRVSAPGAINAFQWSKVRLAMEQPGALATVNRFEADSKFFRIFIPVLFGFFAVALYSGKWTLAAGSLVLLGLALCRYIEQRFKSTQQAYWAILTLESGTQPQQCSAELSDSSKSGDRPAEPTHAGGVVFRGGSKQKVDYLLVQAKTDPNQWVLPKGHIEPGEDPRHCAIREVKEETGVWARVKSQLNDVSFTVNGDPVKVQFFLMEAVQEGKPSDHRREHAWLTLTEALSSASHTESQELLRLAEQKRSAA